MKNRASSLAEHDQFTPAVFSRAESALGNAKSSESIIIQCPSCQTKFALDSARLEGIENPRFHCSRCDQMFGQNETSIISAVTNEPQKQSSFSIPKSIDKGYQPEPPIDAHIPSESSDPLRMSIEKSVVEKPITSEIEPAQIEFLFGGDSSTSHPTPIPSVSSEPTMSFGDVIEQKKDPTSERTAIINDIFDEIESTRKQAVSEAQALASRTKLCSIVDFEKPQSNSTSVSNAQTSNSKLTSASLLKDFPASTSSKLSPIQTSLADAPKRKPPLTAWQSASLLGTMMIVFVGIFALLGIGLVSSPKFAQAFTDSFASSSPIPPPAGLMITDSSFKLVALDNGEKVSVISGNLVNHTEKTIKEVNIDGIAFNQNGGIISSVQGRASSPLTSTRLKSLSLEMIQMLQSRGGTKKFVLKPDASIPFSIVITDPKAENAASYIARIYSVQY